LKIVMIVVRKSLVELDLFAYLQLLPAWNQDSKVQHEHSILPD
jgi:hypothetical protein